MKIAHGPIGMIGPWVFLRDADVIMNEPLDYAGQRVPEHSRWRSRPYVIGLATPSAACMVLFALGANAAYRSLMSQRLFETAVGVLLLVAIPCAITSVILFIPRIGRMFRWDVISNLVINVPVLLFLMYMPLIAVKLIVRVLLRVFLSFDSMGN